jgi:hypothetical protein
MEHTVPLALDLDAIFDIGSKTNTARDPSVVG